MVQPQNQFPRLEIKNRDVAEWDAKVSLHLGRDFWVNEIEFSVEMLTNGKGVAKPANVSVVLGLGE